MFNYKVNRKKEKKHANSDSVMINPIMNILQKQKTRYNNYTSREEENNTKIKTKQQTGQYNALLFSSKVPFIVPKNAFLCQKCS